MPRICLVCTLPPWIGVVHPFPCSRAGSTHPAGSISWILGQSGGAAHMAGPSLLFLFSTSKATSRALVCALEGAGTQGQTLATISLHLVSRCTFFKGFPLSHHFRCLTSRGLTSQSIYLDFYHQCHSGHPDMPSTCMWAILPVASTSMVAPEKRLGLVPQKYPCSSPVPSVPHE